MQNTLKGFYFNLGRKEVFVESTRTRKTEKLLSDILRALQLPDNPGTRKELNYWLSPACLEVKHCPASEEFGTPEHDYYNIYGRGFYGYGSDDVNDGNTIIIKIK